MTKFPAEVLIKLVERLPEDGHGDRGIVNGILGVPDYVWERIRKRGWLTTEQADTIAVTLGYHPYEIWGDLWFDSAEGELCAQADCEEPMNWSTMYHGGRFCQLHRRPQAIARSAARAAARAVRQIGGSCDQGQGASV